MSKNFIALRRGWMDHPVFNDEPYSERCAWVWLIENAVWKDTVINIGNNPVSLKRGQLSYSIRYLASAWKWLKDKVSRFLKKITVWGLIETANETGQTIITICNYSKYQDKREKAATANETEARQTRDRSATNKNQFNHYNKDTDSNARETISSISSLQVLEMHPLGGKHAEWWRKHCPDIDIKTVRDELVRKHRANGETLFDYWPELQNWGTFRQRKHNERPRAVSAATEGLFG